MQLLVKQRWWKDQFRWSCFLLAYLPSQCPDVHSEYLMHKNCTVKCSLSFLLCLYCLFFFSFIQHSVRENLLKFKSLYIRFLQFFFTLQEEVANTLYLKKKKKWLPIPTSLCNNWLQSGITEGSFLTKLMRFCCRCCCCCVFLCSHSSVQSNLPGLVYCCNAQLNCLNSSF